MMGNIFVLEDTDRKFEKVNEVISATLGDSWRVFRASTMVESEELLFAHNWDLFILDVSMNVTSRRPAFGAPAQATLGGLEVAKIITFEGLDAPTILVTAFDSFSDAKERGKSGALVDIGEVEDRAKAILGPYLLGAVRYGAKSWNIDLARFLESIKEC